ncbi:MAG: hypothetical protein ACOYD4_04010 [Solirubrobacterales bacterium]
MRTVLSAWWLLLGLFAGQVWGGDGGTNAIPVSPTAVTFLWDASPDASVTGYTLHVCDWDTNRLFGVNVGMALTATVGNMPTQPLKIYVIAYNSAGTESDPSNILEMNLPAAPVLRVEAILQVDKGGGFTNAVTMGIFDLGEQVGAGSYRVVLNAKPISP